MDARGLLSARDFRCPQAAAELLKRVPPALSHGPPARCGKSILEVTAVEFPNPISVRCYPSERVHDRIFQPDRNQMNKSGRLCEHR